MVRHHRMRAALCTNRLTHTERETERQTLTQSGGDSGDGIEDVKVWKARAATGFIDAICLLKKEKNMNQSKTKPKPTTKTEGDVNRGQRTDGTQSCDDLRLEDNHNESIKDKTDNDSKI